MIGNRQHPHSESADLAGSVCTFRWRVVGAWLAMAVAALAVIATALPFVPSGSWIVRSWDFPRIQLATILAGSMVAIALLRAALPSRLPRLMLVLCAVAFAGQLFFVTPFTALYPVEISTVVLKQSQREPEAKPISILTANVKFESAAFQQVSSELAELDNDILILVEIDEKWRSGLRALESRFPHRHDAIADNGLGICVWSKLPFSAAETRYLVEDHRASIWVEINRGGQAIRIVAVHPTPPGLQDSTGEQRRDSRVRDAELVLVAKEIATEDNGNWIVAGDFNDVAWSSTTRLFKRLSGLKDPRVGRSILPTYHARYPTLRFPIDHVMLSDGFRILSIDRHQISGSDHFAVSAEVVLIAPELGTTPEATIADIEKAEELVDDGREDAVERGIESDSKRE